MKQLTRRSVRTLFALTDTAPGSWVADVDESWRGWTGPHGGVIAGLLTEVAQAAAPDRGSVRAVDVRFLGRPGDGALTFEPIVHAVGRTTSVVDVVVRQEAVVVAAGSVTLGHGAATALAARIDMADLGVAEPEMCAPFEIPREIVPVGAHFDIRPAAGPLPLTGSDEARMCAWVSLVPETTTDAAALIIIADALPPAVFPTLSAPVAVPTVTLSVYLHGDLADVPAQPVLVRASNTSTAAGWSVDDIDIRDRSGRLLAQARQTRRVLG
ncbi:acyl-CoA thioesterase [Nocardia jejuensis]|uniref:acyl-CoA thioesterase n=1 Tax=Nocardia jejuensis TaxID=328049 RepID=UPI00082C3F28|nr:acyl-CoA thioesterase domain-containing protein [Nocardia jejuensis]